MTYFSDLIDVGRVAMVSMMGVLIVGTWVNAAFPRKVEVRHVECSVTLKNMATKFNVTLMDECEITE